MEKGTGGFSLKSNAFSYSHSDKHVLNYFPPGQIKNFDMYGRQSTINKWTHTFRMVNLNAISFKSSQLY